MVNQKLEMIRKNYITNYERTSEKLEQYKLKLNEAIKLNDFRLIEIYQKRVNNSLQRLRQYHSLIEFMREPNYEDALEREIIMTKFPKMVRETIPNNVPIVFHGNRNIGTILEIIKTGGLFTPEQRGVSETSFATQIDVAYKNNISVSCSFAEAGIDSFMPYGAIFAFFPLSSEVEKVLATGENSEVYNGVAGVNFRDDPNRLVGIITTEENKERIQVWCREYQWNEQKVFTHEEFISKCREMFSIEQKQNKSL